MLAIFCSCPSKRGAREIERPVFTIVADKDLGEAKGPFVAGLVRALAGVLSDKWSVVIVGSRGAKVVVSEPLVATSPRMIEMRLDALQKGQASLLERVTVAAKRPSARRMPLLVIATSAIDAGTLAERAKQAAKGHVELELISMQEVLSPHRPNLAQDALAEFWVLRISHLASRYVPPMSIPK